MSSKAAALELCFLGDVRVLRDGQALPLPPSKKTRGLLAYLALHARSFRRDHLCELLWELPDDPRGSLRWSLSKLRRLVDEPGHPRILADRSQVAFDARDARIDVAALRALAGEGLASASIPVLEEAAARYAGHFLEGLELTHLHAFHAWCVAEREGVGRAQARILDALIARLGDDPERALPHARARAALSPYDEAARARLVGLLAAAGRIEEAEQQVRLGERMLQEVGATSKGLLARAWRAPARRDAPAPAPAAARRDAPAPARTPARLVGREAELEQLDAALREVVERRRARLVLLRGEPGIGKSRLLASVAERARAAGAFLLEASAFEAEAMRPFALWIDALRSRGPGFVTDVFGEGDYENRDQLFGGLHDVVARESKEHPVVLSFDDLHWCDESSAAALHYVARMSRDRPLLALLAARDDELRDNGALQQALRGLRRDGLLEELRVGPLSEEAVGRLVREHAPDADGERLGRECGGNPLLAIELLRSERAPAGAGSLDELVRERLARFDLDGVEVLHWAAVLAPRIDVASLARASGLDAGRVGEVLESAERQAILLPAERGFRFSHELVARSIYAGISPARRQVMHRRVAELLEEDAAVDRERAADLAHHAAHSGDPALAARAMVSAGRLCLRFFANDDALSLARTGLSLAEELPDAQRVCLTLDLHDIALAAAPLDDWEEAAEQYVALAEQALDHGAVSHARLGYHMASTVRWMHGQWADARAVTLQAERVSRSASEQEHIVALAETAKCLAMLERDLSQADAMLMEVRALSERRRTTCPAIPAGLGILRFHENRLDEAEELFQEARALCKAAGERVDEFQANEYLVMIDYERGRLESARTHCAALLEIGQRLREGSEAPFARALRGLCDYALDDASEDLERALEELRASDAKHRLAYTLTRAALLDVERGRGGSALARGREALEHATALERASEMMLAHVALARACRALGDAGGYERHVAALAGFEGVPVAQWARQRAADLAADATRGRAAS